MGNPAIKDTRLMASYIPRPPRMRVGSLLFDSVTMGQAVRYMMDWAEHVHGEVGTVAAANAHFVYTAHQDPAFREYLENASLCVADGASVVLASRFLGQSLPERVTGIDLMTETCREAALRGHSVYLLGGRPEAAEKAAKVLRREYPGLKVVGVDRPPIGQEFKPEVVAQIRERIREARPDFLFVCIGVPNQEAWIQQHALDLPIKMAMGNGAAFDVLAGYFRRPPVWIQKIGMEWLYRFCVEPERLFKRYTVGNMHFVNLVFSQWLRERKSA